MQRKKQWTVGFSSEDSVDDQRDRTSGDSPRRLVRTVESVGLIAVWCATVALFSILAPATFPTWTDFATLFSSQGVLVVLALGALLPLVAGDFDISIAYNLTFCSMVVAVLNVNGHWNIVGAVMVALFAGIAIGVVNGLITVYGGLNSFIVTLGTGTVLAGLTDLISGSTSISGVSAGLFRGVGQPAFGGLGLVVVYALVATVAVWYFLERTAAGRRLLFVGRSKEVARLTGLRVKQLRLSAFVAAGFMGGIAGVLYAGTTSSADPTSGTTLLLPAFAAVFLGATTIKPGRFNAVGTLCAAYFLATGIQGLSLLGAQVYVQNLFDGGALVVAVVAGRLMRLQHLAFVSSTIRSGTEANSGG